MLRTILSFLLALIGVALLAGDVWLAALGGSWFYIVLGAAVAVSGALLLQRRSARLALYGATLIASLAWSVWEVGFDRWVLSARGSLLIVLGLLLLLPPMVRSLHRLDVGWARYGANGAVLAGAIVLCLVVGVYAMFQSPHDVAGTFSADRMAARQEVAANGVPDGEWHADGRTAAGRRFSPLDQITPDNVGKLQVAWTYHTGDVRGPDDPGEATYEVTPL